MFDFFHDTLLYIYLPEDDVDTIEAFLESLEMEDNGRLNLLLLRSRNPAEVASSSFLGICVLSWLKVSPTSSSDIFKLLKHYNLEKRQNNFGLNPFSIYETF